MAVRIDIDAIAQGGRQTTVTIHLGNPGPGVGFGEEAGGFLLGVVLKAEHGSAAGLHVEARQAGAHVTTKRRRQIVAELRAGVEDRISGPFREFRAADSVHSVVSDGGCRETVP
jgi:hypothetical protein